MKNKIKFIGVVAVIGIAYFTRDKWMRFFTSDKKKESEVKSGFVSAQDKLGTFTKIESKSNFVSCRAGTCPYTRSDGSVFCTSAACPKSSSNTMTS